MKCPKAHEVKHRLLFLRLVALITLARTTQNPPPGPAFDALNEKRVSKEPLMR